MKKEKQDLKTFAFNVGKAAAGGILAEIGADYIAKNSPDLIANNPKVTEIIPIGAGAAAVYFLPKEWHPLGYGMIGAGASGFADDIMGAMQGFSRVNYMNGAKEEEIRRGLEIIDKMQGVGFENAPDPDEEDSNGMSY